MGRYLDLVDKPESLREYERNEFAGKSLVAGAEATKKGYEKRPADALALELAALDAQLTTDELRAELAPEDLADIEAGDFPPASLRAFARSVAQRRQMEAGEAPRHYTATTFCRSCNREVPIFPGASPAVDGCPWCWNRARGLPVPVCDDDRS